MSSWSKIKYIEKNKQFLYLNLSHISNGLKMEQIVSSFWRDRSWSWKFLEWEHIVWYLNFK